MSNLLDLDRPGTFHFPAQINLHKNIIVYNQIETGVWPMIFNIEGHSNIYF